LHGPRAGSDFLASAKVMCNDFSSWVLSSCVKLSPDTGFGSEFHQAIPKDSFLCEVVGVDYCSNFSDYVLTLEDS
jgi:hypothetical protein